MATRAELNTAIAALTGAVEAEKTEVLGAIDRLNTTVAELKAKIEELELPQDFSAELAAVESAAAAIAAIYNPTPVEPVE